MLVPAGLLVGVAYTESDKPFQAMTLLTLGVALTGVQYGGGLYLNAGDIAPQYAGIIYGISNTFATIPGFVSPLAIGYLTTQVSTLYYVCSMFDHFLLRMTMFKGILLNKIG